ncbi:hypothetical protein PGT21_006805 [Puccinia graminis f. sp. tritici]|uniref:Uncharacterized protein n=1 Tax=Puccinia graminis f. sp. tritici TaxID=56615 RepID=A0A5B0NXQ9_PUCGR|nr:hypothetical protein PGT21_006805 [Puccinia graminis f. sp. tritici]
MRPELRRQSSFGDRFPTKTSHTPDSPLKPLQITSALTYNVQLLEARHTSLVPRDDSVKNCVRFLGEYYDDKSKMVCEDNDTGYLCPKDQCTSGDLPGSYAAVSFAYKHTFTTFPLQRSRGTKVACPGSLTLNATGVLRAIPMPERLFVGAAVVSKTCLTGAPDLVEKRRVVHLCKQLSGCTGCISPRKHPNSCKTSNPTPFFSGKSGIY